MQILKKYSDLVVLPHSVFALPFALVAMLLASKQPGAIKLDATIFIYVVLCLITARTSAMAFNRLIDADIDAKNPRTQTRHLPAGELSKNSVRVLVFASSSLFLLFAGLIGTHCLVLAPVVLLVLLGYSYTKRFTSAAHLVLGLALALAPGGAWWALYPVVHVVPLVMMATVLMWVAGFDILYSCQDAEFDNKEKLFSVPAKLGIGRALQISFALHIVALFGFISLGSLADLPSSYYIGMLVLGAFLISQHFLVSENNLKLINRAFFTFNGLVSIGYFLLVWALI